MDQVSWKVVWHHFITAHGMVVSAMFRSEEDENLFIWIRRFDNEAHREEVIPIRL